MSVQTWSPYLHVNRRIWIRLLRSCPVPELCCKWTRKQRWISPDIKTGNQPFLIVGAIICGATSGIFWITEAAVTLLYSEPDRKGRHIALWQSLYQSANLIGGSINLALNIDLDKPGGLKPKTCVLRFVVIPPR